MFIIELTLKGNPLSLSVQRKEHEDATGLYQRVLDAMRSGQAQMLELTCEKQPDKKLAVLSTEVSAVQVFEKSASNATSATGFFRG
ncbi:hypothetical protein [Leptolyngbya sp. FACHB-261]|uniref:hypothetical protein n=1 Tax=Leptolyngbya sp. FACHB-261 TaxID=2692806 RepID=UPI001688486C|nr:hypothetical protein [Leptolyngbya sp. FACHB-261]MBD2102367.1 hypothetical protein [Leptolyngbya sp. FACHB-261]